MVQVCPPPRLLLPNEKWPSPHIISWRDDCQRAFLIPKLCPAPTCFKYQNKDSMRDYPIATNDISTPTPRQSCSKEVDLRSRFIFLLLWTWLNNSIIALGSVAVGGAINCENYSLSLISTCNEVNNQDVAHKVGSQIAQQFTCTVRLFAYWVDGGPIARSIYSGIRLKKLGYTHSCDSMVKFWGIVTCLSILVLTMFHGVQCAQNKNDSERVTRGELKLETVHHRSHRTVRMRDIVTSPPL